MRTSKRVYTTTALEAWFQKLASDWEHYFDPETLEAGRQRYREGDIREVELGEHDAIIHAKADGESVYAVVDWDGRKPRVRYSREDEREGDALGVAGLYEVEELVSEEADPLPPEVKAAANGAKVEEETPEEPPEEAPMRTLVLDFDVKAHSLSLMPRWQDEAGQELLAVGEGSDDNPNHRERERLIALTSMAHRAGFRFDNKRNAYLFEDMASLPLFLSKDWPRWQERFEVRPSKRVAKVFEGVRVVDFDIEAESSSEIEAELKWRVSAGKTRFNQREVRHLFKRGEHPVIVPGKGLFRIAERRTSVVAEWKSHLGSGLSSKVPRYMLFSLFREEGLKLKLSEPLRRWRDSFSDTPDVAPELPDFLRDYQRAGVQWLYHLCERGCHALLADEMGLGKTVQMLGLLAARPSRSKPSLIVCPASVLPVWEQEVARFFPQMRTRILSRHAAFDSREPDVLWLASYTQLRRHKHLLADMPFAYCVLDEAQYIKNPEAKVTQACYAIQAEHRLALTGTPLENHYQDVWALFRFLMPGLLGSRARFERESNRMGEDFVSYVRTQIAPFTLRRRKTDVLEELPEKVELELLCPMTDLQLRHYRALVQLGERFLDTPAQAVNGQDRMHLFSLLTRLRQASCDPGLLPDCDAAPDQSGKLLVLRDKLGELLESGHKVVVFSQFVQLLKRIRGMLDEQAAAQCFELTGQSRDRGALVERFQSHPEAAVMLVSLKAGGTGITLHAADYVFMIDPWWNPAVEAQAVDRVHRIGQNNRVFVYRMITKGSLEEKIQKLQADKREAFEGLIGSMKDNSDLSLSYSDLRYLLSVSQLEGATA